MPIKKESIKRERVINGCKVCRTRRIKCDAQRPSCQRCIKANRKCEYRNWELAVNNDPSSPASHASSSLAVASSPTNRRHDYGSPHSPQSQSDFALAKSPTIERPHVDDNVRSALDYFLVRTVNKMLEQSGAPHLTYTYIHTAIPISLYDPALTLAIAATSFSSRAMMPIVHTSLARPQQTAANALALEYFCQASQLVQKQLAKSAHGPGEIESILLACMFFLAFEVMQGNVLNALRHMRSAKCIVQSIPDTEKLPNNHPVVIAKKWSWHPSDGKPVLPKPLFSPVLASIEEASGALEGLLETGQRLQRELLDAANKALNISYPDLNAMDVVERFCLAHCLARVISPSSRSGFEARLDRAILSHLSWRTQVSKLLKLQPERSTSVLHLHICYFNSLYIVQNCRRTKEVGIDLFAESFDRALQHAEEYLALRKEAGSPSPPSSPPPPPSSSGTKPLRRSLIWEWGPLAALFTIAVKSRSLRTRSAAVKALFHAERQEGDNGSLVLSLYADTMARIEQQREQHSSRRDSATATNGEWLGESARIVDAVFSPVNDTGSAIRIHCARFAHERSGEIELVEYQRSVRGHVDFERQQIRTEDTPADAAALGGDIVSVRTTTYHRIGDWSCDGVRRGVLPAVFEEVPTATTAPIMVST